MTMGGDPITGHPSQMHSDGAAIVQLDIRRMTMERRSYSRHTSQMPSDGAAIIQLDIRPMTTGGDHTTAHCEAAKSWRAEYCTQPDHYKSTYLPTKQEAHGGVRVSLPYAEKVYCIARGY